MTPFLNMNIQIKGKKKFIREINWRFIKMSVKMQVH